MRETPGTGLGWICPVRTRASGTPLADAWQSVLPGAVLLALLTAARLRAALPGRQQHAVAGCEGSDSPGGGGTWHLTVEVSGESDTLTASTMCCDGAKREPQTGPDWSLTLACFLVWGPEATRCPRLLTS